MKLKLRNVKIVAFREFKVRRKKNLLFFRNFQEKLNFNYSKRFNLLISQNLVKYSRFQYSKVEISKNKTIFCRRKNIERRFYDLKNKIIQRSQ